MPKTYAVPPPPHHNEGKTVAGWTMNLGIVLGALCIGIGMVISPLAVLIWVGAAIIALAIIIVRAPRRPRLRALTTTSRGGDRQGGSDAMPAPTGAEPTRGIFVRGGRGCAAPSPRARGSRRALPRS